MYLSPVPSGSISKDFPLIFLAGSKYYHYLCTVIAKNVGTKNFGIWKILLDSGL